MKVIQCKICGRKPEEIKEYIDVARVYEYTPQEYVSIKEGTFNRSTGKFYCTSCYIKIGMPLGTA